MAGLTSFQRAKPDDPIYKEGWSIHIGPLPGTRGAGSNEQTQKADSSVKEQAKQNAGKAEPTQQRSGRKRGRSDSRARS